MFLKDPFGNKFFFFFLKLIGLGILLEFPTILILTLILGMLSSNGLLYAFCIYMPLVRHPVQSEWGKYAV